MALAFGLWCFNAEAGLYPRPAYIGFEVDRVAL